MYYEVSEFHPAPYTVHFALDDFRLRPWVKYKYCRLYHDLDLYEIGHC